MKVRYDALRTQLKEGQALLVLSPENRFYLTGLHSTAGSFLLTKKNAVLFVDFRYFEMAERLADGYDVVLVKRELEQLEALLLAEEVTKLYIEPGRVSVARYQRLCENLPELRLSKSDRLEEEIRHLRMVKDGREQELIARAQSITDAAFGEMLSFVREGQSEREIAAELEYRMKKLGADSFAFDTIVLSGENTAMPHGRPSDRTVKAGEFVLMDFGAMVGGYCSDMTRTFAIKSADELMRDVYATVLRAQNAALLMLRAGVSGRSADAAAREVIERGYPDTFGHSLGHSLGVEIHEDPNLAPRADALLSEGMIVTVEPGIYLPGRFGVRIEDFVMILKDGVQNFTKSPKELLVL